MTELEIRLRLVELSQKLQNVADLLSAALEEYEEHIIK